MTVDEHGPMISELVEFRGPAEIEINLPAHFWPPGGLDGTAEAELARLVDHYVVGYEVSNPDGSLVGVAHRLLTGLRLKRDTQAVTPVIGGYGTGKSYLALMLAVLLSRRVEDPLVVELLKNMRRAVGDDLHGEQMVNDIRQWIEERPRPYLVVPLVFDRNAAVSLFTHLVEGVNEAIARWPEQPSLEESGLRLKLMEAMRLIKRWRDEAPAVAEDIDARLRSEYGYSLDDLRRNLEEPSRTDAAIRDLSKVYEEATKVRLPLEGVAGIEPFLEHVVDSYATFDDAGNAPPFEGVIIMLDEFHHYLDVQAHGLSTSDPGSRLDLQEFAGAVRRRAEYLGLMLLSPTGLVEAIDQVASGISDGEAAKDLRRFKERLGKEVRLTYRHFLHIARSFLRHRTAWEAFSEEHRAEFEEQARWLLDWLPNECPGMNTPSQVRTGLVERLYPLHPLAALLLCGHLVNKLEQNRTLGRMFVPEDGELASWSRQTPSLVGGQLQWFTALDVIRFYRHSLNDRRFLDTWRDAETALKSLLPDAGKPEIDVLLAVILLHELSLPWPATEDVVVRMMGRPEHEVREALQTLVAQGILGQAGGGRYYLDVGRRKTRLKYDEELTKALAERAATKENHPTYWLNEHLAGRASWMSPANVGLPSGSSQQAKSGPYGSIRPDGFLRQHDIVTDQAASRSWAWRLEYIPVASLNISSLRDKVKGLTKVRVDSKRGGLILRVLPVNDSDLDRARRMLGDLLPELEENVPAFAKHFVIALPDAPVDVIEPLEKLHLYGNTWEREGLIAEFADILREERKLTATQLQTRLEEAFTSPNVYWHAPGTRVTIDRSRHSVREPDVVSQVLRERFHQAPPMPQAIAQRSLEELLPFLLHDDVGVILRMKKPQSKPRLIVEQVLARGWEALEATNDYRLRLPGEQKVREAFDLLDNLWREVEDGTSVLLWSDAGALFDEPFGYGKYDTWRLLIASYLGLRLQRGGQLETVSDLDVGGTMPSTTCFLRKSGPNSSDFSGDNDRLLEHFTTTTAYRDKGIRWTPLRLLAIEDETSPPSNDVTTETDLHIEETKAGENDAKASAAHKDVDGQGTSSGTQGAPQGVQTPSVVNGEAPIKQILQQFEKLERGEQVETVNSMYHKLPKKLREEQLLTRWIDES